MSTLRPELPPLPETMKDLPIHRGYPVPWFVEWINGEPEFRAMSGIKFALAIQQQLCWVCGEPFTNRRKAFNIGPMCAVNRTSAEPPSHPECARFSALACPFLSRPEMVRRMNNLPENITVQEGHLPNNPGVTLIWFTRNFRLVPFPNNLPLIHMGEPDNWEWYMEARPASRAEILGALALGSHKVYAMAENDEERLDFKSKYDWVVENMVPRS